MRIRLQSRLGQEAAAGLVVAIHVFLLFLPALLLLLGSLRTTGQTRMLIGAGAAFQIVVCLLHFSGRRSTDHPLGPSVVSLYLIALGWLWVTAGHTDDWFLCLVQAMLLVMPMVVFGCQTLSTSGAPAVRRAQVLADRLARRKDWPLELSACRNMADVKALREALRVDAAPALALLRHGRREVRIAALAALEFHKDWRPGQAELVLRLAQESDDSAFRAAAVSALANLDNRNLVEAMAEFLNDSSAEVRRAAVEALLWDSERRWPWIRVPLRRHLGNPAHQGDGPLRHDGQMLPLEAVKDLHAWAAERGQLALRASQTLGLHYARCLTEYPDEELIQDLRHRLTDVHTPTALRVELARLLHGGHYLDHTLLERLLDPGNSAPLRLLAADTLLGDGTHSEAVHALHEIAHVPNREIALATADVVQRRLGVDLGLPVGQPLPQVHSRQAAEVTRRVMNWAEAPNGECAPASAS
jgi:hypothetical protein